MLTPADARTVNAILQKVVSQGTGVRAQLPDRPVAGKTGTTENYGDAWFVGYTPQLVVAVWVGYPKTLQPMLTEFDGEAVTGGSFPAEIWKAFAAKALEGEEPQVFAYPPYRSVEPKLVVRRGERLLLDNGICDVRQEVVYFADRGPQASANCRENEVEVPNVIGQRLSAAESRLTAKPLTAEVVYKPAEPLQRAGLVLDQRPKRGFAAPFDKVILVVTKPLHGVIPNLVGKSLDTARARLERLKLDPDVTYVDGPRLRRQAEPEAWPRSGSGRQGRARRRPAASPERAAEKARARDGRSATEARRLATMPTRGPRTRCAGSQAPPGARRAGGRDGARHARRHPERLAEATGARPKESLGRRGRGARASRPTP